MIQDTKGRVLASVLRSQFPFAMLRRSEWKVGMSKSICVFCAASDAVDSVYFKTAAQLGAILAQQGHTLVYGGGSIGLMGTLARAVHRASGKVVGVIAESMLQKESVYREADDLVVTKCMRERKDVMDKRSDAFIALPGGFGTLEELLEVLTYRQLGFHAKPIVIVDTNGFYDPLIKFFDHFIEQHFANPRHRESFYVASSPPEAMAFLDP